MTFPDKKCSVGPMFHIKHFLSESFAVLLGMLWHSPLLGELVRAWHRRWAWHGCRVRLRWFDIVSVKWRMAGVTTMRTSLDMIQKEGNK